MNTELIEKKGNRILDRISKSYFHRPIDVRGSRTNGYEQNQTILIRNSLPPAATIHSHHQTSLNSINHAEDRAQPPVQRNYIKLQYTDSRPADLAGVSSQKFADSRTFLILVVSGVVPAIPHCARGRILDGACVSVRTCGKRVISSP